MTSSSSSVLIQVEAALKCVYDPRTSSASRSQCTADLDAFRSSPSSFSPALQWLTGHVNDTGPSLSHHAQFFSATVLYHTSTPAVFDRSVPQSQRQNLLGEPSGGGEIESKRRTKALSGYNGEYSSFSSQYQIRLQFLTPSNLPLRLITCTPPRPSVT